MFRWLRSKIEKATISTMESDIDRFLAGLKGASRGEVGTVLASAAHWRNALERGLNWDLDHPDFVAMQDISAALRLNRMIRDLQAKGQQHMAAGLMVWLHTIRASQTPELRLKGRAMWSELMRGVQNVDEGVRSFALFGIELDTAGYRRVPENLGSRD